MIITLISFIVGCICGSLATYFGIKSGVKITHLAEDREREFALRVTNIEQGAIPIEQENTYGIEQETTQGKGIEDVPPENRSDIFQGTKL